MGTNKDGYGQFKIFKDGFHYTILTHRVSFYLKHGHIDGKLQMCHNCDNPGCCNPSHQYQGTQLDNMRDKVARGRAYSGDKKGVKANRAILNDDKVREIRRRFAVGERAKLLAEEFGVGQRQIYYITSHVTWPHVT